MVFRYLKSAEREPNMSDITTIVEKYARGGTSLGDTVEFLLSVHIMASSLNGNHSEGSWSEVEKLLNTGVLSFMQYRDLNREYRKATHENRKFVILGEDYGYVEDQ